VSAADTDPADTDPADTDPADTDPADTDRGSGSSNGPPRRPWRPVPPPPGHRPRCLAARPAAPGRRRTRSRRFGATAAPRAVGLLVCAGQVGQVDAAGWYRLSGRADTGHGLPDTGSPHAPALRTPTTAAGACGHRGSGHAGQPAAAPSTTAAMSDRNGTALCGTGQHPGLTARSVAWCSASDWSAPDGSALLRLGASSVQAGPEGTCRIVWMIKHLPTPNRMARVLEAHNWAVPGALPRPTHGPVAIQLVGPAFALPRAPSFCRDVGFIRG
jgi:hypothetical protein